MKKLILAVIVLVNFNCKESNYKSNEHQNLKDTTVLPAFYIGKWGGIGEEMPVWNILKDSIYYYQQNRSYSYKYTNGDLIIDFNGSKGILKKIRCVLDTLFFQDERGNTIKGYRFH